jgi:Zn-dependent metalloprotease
MEKNLGEIYIINQNVNPCDVPKCGASITLKRTKRNPVRSCRKTLTPTAFSYRRRRPRRKRRQPKTPITPEGYKNVDLYTSYLGKVSVPVYDFGNGNVALQSMVPGLDGKPITVKCIDAQQSRLSSQYQYDVSQLIRIDATVTNIDTNKQIWTALQRIVDKEGKHPYLAALNSTDIQFQTCNFLEFLHTELKINSMNDDGALVSIHNYTQLDNAFNTGTYMVYGNGDRMFYPMGCIDVTGHELVHGLTSHLSGLKYEGESGALNEGFSDVIGCTFEAWMYRKYNTNTDKTDDIDGVFDWLMGEDVGKGMKYLRNMRDPNDADSPQPKIYKGKHWLHANGPPSESNDYNGVHVNSGVLNYCFYLFAQRVGMYSALRDFVEVLKTLKPTSQYADFSVGLRMVTSNKQAAIASLIAVGLL